MLDEICSWSNFLSNFFWFIQPNFQGGHIWVQFHPTSGFSPMRWLKIICGGACFKRFYWYLNVNNLWRATKSQKMKGHKQEKKEEAKATIKKEKKSKSKKRLDQPRYFIAYLHAPSKPLFMERVSHWLYQRGMKDIAYKEIAILLDRNIPLTKN